MNVCVARCTILLLGFGLVAPVLRAEEPRAVAAATQFHALDVNQDGVVSKYEYDGEFAFELMDSNHDKRVSAGELQALLGPPVPRGPTVAERIVVADLDADGQLDENELRRAAEMRFEVLDRNGDGNLDQAELTSGFGVRAR